MIKRDEYPWLREYLLKLAQTDEDKASVREIIKTFQLLWQVVSAGARYRDLRSNENLAQFCAALDTVRPIRRNYEHSLGSTVTLHDDAAGDRDPMDEAQGDSQGGQLQDPNADHPKP